MMIGFNSELILMVSAGDIGNYYYGQGHPMKPHRIRMTHNLLLNYGLYRKMEVYVRLQQLQSALQAFSSQLKQADESLRDEATL